jgi:hypothetical protein
MGRIEPRSPPVVSAAVVLKTAGHCTLTCGPTRTRRTGAATLDCVDDLRARAASADQERRERLNQRLRQAFIAGAEEDSRRRLGRGLTSEELERVLWRYPGDIGADMTRRPRL